MSNPSEIPTGVPQLLQEGAAEALVNNDKRGRLLQILAFNFDMKMAALAGNRFTGYEINIGGATYIECLSPALPEKAPDGSNLYGICGWIGAPHDSVASSRTIILPLPEKLLIPVGGRWEAIAPSKQAGDTFPLFRLAYQFV